MQIKFQRDLLELAERRVTARLMRAAAETKNRRGFISDLASKAFGAFALLSLFNKPALAGVPSRLCFVYPAVRWRAYGDAAM
jgi:hypothetical protein